MWSPCFTTSSLGGRGGREAGKKEGKKGGVKKRKNNNVTDYHARMHVRASLFVWYSLVCGGG